MASGSIDENDQDFTGQKTFQAGRAIAGSPTSQGHRTAGQLFASALAGGNGADQTEDIVHTFSLPPNALDKIGRRLRITVWGTTAASADNKQVKVYFGASAVFASGVAAANAKPFKLVLEVVKTGANTQSCIGTGEFNGAFIPAQRFAGTEVDTAAITIKSTAQDSTASTANAITIDQTLVEVLN